jgi:HlyD family secretion protein
MIDIPQKPPRIARLGKPVLVAALVLVLAGLAGAYWMRGDEPGAVSAADLVIARVEHGRLDRVVRAPGVVVPIEIRWMAATVEGRIERKLLEAGEKVHPDTLILQMSSPTLSRNLDTARIELEVQEAQSNVLQRQLISDELAQQAVVANFQMNYENARIRMEANQAARSAVPALNVRESELSAEMLRDRVEVEKKRLERLRELQVARLRADHAELERARRQLKLQQELVDALSIRAGIEGTLQDLPVEVGQQISVGTRLARVAGDGNYKVELRVQEQQAKEIKVGQPAQITAGGQQGHGTVSRVDPAVQDGTVRVDVLFTGAPLPGARPDLRVQGLIETGSVPDALIVQRPVSSDENEQIELFVVDAAGRAAERRPVQFGLASTDKIQVMNGLREGEAVIVSDIGRFTGLQRITLAE